MRPEEGDEEGVSLRLAHFCSRLDDLPGVPALGILFSLSPPHVFKGALVSVLFWFAVHMVIGAESGVVTHYFYSSIEASDRETDPGELTLVFFGMLCLSSGFAAYLDLSPLFVGMVSGVVFANVSEHSDTLGAALAEREHTVFVLFLVVSGCYWPFRSFTAWHLLVLYLGVRTVGKVAGSTISQKFFETDQVAEARGASERFGLALMPQGGLAIAMVVSYLWSFSEVAATWAVNVVHISVIVNDLMAPYLMTGLDKKKE